jgi:hypothetical protein
MEITVTLTIHTPELATAVLALADVLGDMLNRTNPGTAEVPAAETKPTTTTPATLPTAAKEIAATTTAATTTTTTPTVTLEEVRGTLAQLSKAGKQAQVKELIEGFAATKLTRAHAILSASGSKRWLTCTPSALLEEQFAEETSTYADEGTLAHTLGELQLSKSLDIISKGKAESRLAAIQSHSLYAPEMLDHIDTYVTVVCERISEARARSKDAFILLEQRLDFSAWVPEGFGTGDVVIIADRILEIVDLKYGKGVPVSAVENTQMRLYALGALNHYGMLYDIDVIRMTICQPRLDSVSTDEISTEALLKWGEEVVKPLAQRAIAGEGEFAAGDHCKFCRARYTCRARAETNLELARFEFKKAPLLTTAEIAEILQKAADLQAWAGDIASHALNQAERFGVQYPGWKLVEGRSNRKYADVDAVTEALIKAGYPEALIFEKTLYGITKMEENLGKKAFNNVLKDLLIKPPGKPALVPESDRRPAIQSAASAAEDFAEPVA